MAEGEEIVEEIDEGPVQALRDAREAANRNAKRAKDESDARQRLEGELATVRGEIRAGNLTSILASLGASEGLAGVYPADAEVTEDAVSKWVTEDLKLTPTPPTKSEEWANYERLQSGAQTPGPGRTELEKMFAEGTEALTEMIGNPFDVSLREKVGKTTREFLQKAQQMQDAAEPGIYSGQNEMLIDEGRGFGGPFDVPPFAQTAKSFRAGRVSE